jgi:hypothetical protein
MQMTARDLKDAGVPRYLIEHEARKWPWRKWNSQWRELDQVLLRRITVDTHVEKTNGLAS